jgi:hypothetical protein
MTGPQRVGSKIIFILSTPKPLPLVVNESHRRNRWWNGISPPFVPMIIQNVCFNASMTLQQIDRDLAKLNEQRQQLLELQPLLENYTALVAQIKTKDPTWKPSADKAPRFDMECRRFIMEHGGPMTLDELVTDFNGRFTDDTLEASLTKHIACKKAKLTFLNDRYGVK